MSGEVAMPCPLRWSADGTAIALLDQTELPGALVWRRIETAADMAQAIQRMQVRGAPAIGIAAAMAVGLELRRCVDCSPEDFQARLRQADALLRDTRPTAVNLFWALDRMQRRAELEFAAGATPSGVAASLEAEAEAILAEDREAGRRIGEFGLELLAARSSETLRILTHCNAGALATGGIGTALAPVYLAHGRGRRLEVFACETRPLLQGSRLTAWELEQAGVPVTVLPDCGAAELLRQSRIHAVLVGADRIAANGDVVNKLGTYGLALLAREHAVPFYVAAPLSTVDPATAVGADVAIEERHPDETRRCVGAVTAPPHVRVFAPAFDVTPAELVTAIITDGGVLRPPYERALAGLRDRDSLEPPARDGFHPLH